MKKRDVFIFCKHFINGEHRVSFYQRDENEYFLVSFVTELKGH